MSAGRHSSEGFQAGGGTRRAAKDGAAAAYGIGYSSSVDFEDQSPSEEQGCTVHEQASAGEEEGCCEAAAAAAAAAFSFLLEYEPRTALILLLKPLTNDSLAASSPASLVTGWPLDPPWGCEMIRRTGIMNN